MPANLLYANEGPDAWPESWYAASARPAPERPALDGDARADVCIVGGGYCGLSAALHLAERGVDVALVEAQRVGWGASGRNGGQIGVGQRVEQPSVEEMVDAETARLAWEVGRDAAAKVKSLVRERGIDCALTDGLIYVNHRQRYDAPTRAYAEHMAERCGADFRYLEPAEVAERVGARGLSGGIEKPSGGHLHPLNYARGLADLAEAAGARLHERTEATAIEGTTVVTPCGRIRADKVIVAANGYLGGLLPEIGARILPINNFVLATEPLPEAHARAVIAGTEAVADSRFVVNYWRLSEDRRLLFGGGESYGWRFPSDLKRFVRTRMLRLYPDLAEVAVTHAWGGTLAITRSRLPVWGEPRPGVFCALGWSGSGVALATMAGEVLSEALAGDRARFDAMTRLPAPPLPGGRLLRRPGLIAAMLIAQLRDAL